MNRFHFTVFTFHLSWVLLEMLDFTTILIKFEETPQLFTTCTFKLKLPNRYHALCQLTQL